MVNDAEKYKSEDDQQRERIQAKNQLESYAFNMKSTVEDEKLKDKISDEDKTLITDKCNEVISWLDSNQVSTKLHLTSKKTSKHHITGPLQVESTGDWWFVLMKGQSYGKCFHIISCKIPVWMNCILIEF